MVDHSRQSSVSDEHAIQMHKSESITSQQKSQKLRFVPSVEYRHSSGMLKTIKQEIEITST